MIFLYLLRYDKKSIHVAHINFFRLSLFLLSASTFYLPLFHWLSNILASMSCQCIILQPPVLWGELELVQFWERYSLICLYWRIVIFPFFFLVFQSFCFLELLMHKTAQIESFSSYSIGKGLRVVLLTLGPSSRIISYCTYERMVVLLHLSPTWWMIHAAESLGKSCRKGWRGKRISSSARVWLLFYDDYRWGFLWSLGIGW